MLAGGALRILLEREESGETALIARAARILAKEADPQESALR